jgi:hypothetical protein
MHFVHCKMDTEYSSTRYVSCLTEDTVSWIGTFFRAKSTRRGRKEVGQRSDRRHRCCCCEKNLPKTIVKRECLDNNNSDLVALYIVLTGTVFVGQE